MEIEEGFRDLKSSQFGFSFEHAYSSKIRRIQILLMIAMLAAYILFFIGWIAEELKWHYQFTPHDIHDWDATEPNVLVDTKFRGQDKKLLLHADRNGFNYTMDRFGKPMTVKLKGKVEPYLREPEGEADKVD